MRTTTGGGIVLCPGMTLGREGKSEPEPSIYSKDRRETLLRGGGFTSELISDGVQSVVKPRPGT